MNYRLVLQPEAEADLDEAYLWYEKQRVGDRVKAFELAETREQILPVNC